MTWFWPLASFFGQCSNLNRYNIHFININNINATGPKPLRVRQTSFRFTEGAKDFTLLPTIANKTSKINRKIVNATLKEQRTQCVSQLINCLTPISETETHEPSEESTWTLLSYYIKTTYYNSPLWTIFIKSVLHWCWIYNPNVTEFHFFIH